MGEGDSSTGKFPAAHGLKPEFCPENSHKRRGDIWRCILIALELGRLVSSQGELASLVFQISDIVRKKEGRKE